MMLSQVNPTATGLLEWLACLGFLLGIAVAVKALLPKSRQKQEIEPQPLIVQLEDKFVDRTSFKQLAETVERNRAAAEESREKLYLKVDEVRKELSAKIDTQSAEFGTALRDMPSQIVALLRNAGIIK